MLGFWVWEWLRRLMHGKNLDDIQRTFEKTENDLAFFMEKKQAEQLALGAAIDAMEKAKSEERKQEEQADIFYTNLKTLRTKKIEHE